MKKIIAALLIFSALFTVANAQKVTGTFAPLRDEARVRMNIDFYEADIMGMSEEEFADFEKDWNHDKVDILAYLYENANDALNGAISVGNYKQETEYTLDLVVRTVNARGDYDCDLFLFRNLADGSQEFVAEAEGINARGGKIGTKLNLMKDGAKHTGKALGKFLLQNMKKTGRNR